MNCVWAKEKHNFTINLILAKKRILQQRKEENSKVKNENDF